MTEINQLTQALKDYSKALKRLKAGSSVNVPKGTKITKDAVSLEAGRGKGSIKKSRSEFSLLIHDIETAAAEQAKTSPEVQLKKQLQEAKEAICQLRKDLETVTSSLVSRLYETHELKKKMRTLEVQVQTSSEPLSRASNATVKSIKPKLF